MQPLYKHKEPREESVKIMYIYTLHSCWLWILMMYVGSYRIRSEERDAASTKRDDSCNCVCIVLGSMTYKLDIRFRGFTFKCKRAILSLVVLGLGISI